MRKQVESAVRVFRDTKKYSVSELTTQGRVLADEVLRLTKLVSKTNKQINHTCANMAHGMSKNG